MPKESTDNVPSRIARPTCFRYDVLLRHRIDFLPDLECIQDHRHGEPQRGSSKGDALARAHAVSESDGPRIEGDDSFIPLNLREEAFGLEGERIREVTLVMKNAPSSKLVRMDSIG